MSVAATPIGSVHEAGEEIDPTVTLDAVWGADGDIVINKGSGLIKQKILGTWSSAVTATAPIGAIHEVGEEIDAGPALQSDFGANNDLVINKPAGLIYQKAAGSWGQIYPIIIM